MKQGALLLLLVLLGGCNAFRASAGIGLGIGGSAKVGPVDVGCLGGVDLAVGNYYDDAGGHLAGDVGLPGLARLEVVAFDKTEARLGLSSLLLLPFYPLMLASDDEKAQEGVPFLYARPFEVAVSAYAVIFAIHLGFDPSVIVRDVARFVSLAAGGADDDPPAPANANFPPPEDGLLEVPYTLLGPDDVAALESGTLIETARQWARFAGVMGDLRTLVAIDDEHYDRWAEPRVGLEFASLLQVTRRKVGALRANETADAFSRAAASRDPEVIAEALARSPLGPLDEIAALERRRGELLVERGDLERAEWSFEDSLRHLADLSEVAGSRARLETVQRLRAETPARPARRNAWAGAADMEGMSIGASGNSVWCTTASGDVAWERSDALPGGFTASRVLGVEAGFAILEVQAASGRPWVVALDFTGNVAWMTPLPAALAVGSPMDQFYVLGLGRVFVARVDRVLALDAANGRVLWMTARKAEFNFELKKTVIPLDWRPRPGPTRRRPDGESGFQVRLAGTTLEVTVARGEPTRRFEVRSGKPVAAD